MTATSSAIRVTKVFELEDVAAECGYDIKAFDKKVEDCEVVLVSIAGGDIDGIDDAMTVTIPLKDTGGVLRPTRVLVKRSQAFGFARAVLVKQLEGRKLNISDLPVTQREKETKALIRPFRMVIGQKFQNWAEKAKKSSGPRERVLTEEDKEALAQIDFRRYGVGKPYLSMLDLSEAATPADVPLLLGEISEVERTRFLEFWPAYWAALEPALRQQMKDGGDRNDGNFDIWKFLKAFAQEWKGAHEGHLPFLRVTVLSRQFSRDSGKFFLVGRQEAIDHVKNVVMPAQIGDRPQSFWDYMKLGQLVNAWCYAWVDAQRTSGRDAENEASAAEIAQFAGGEVNWGAMADAFGQIQEAEAVGNESGRNRRRDRRDRDRSDR